MVMPPSTPAGRLRQFIVTHKKLAIITLVVLLAAVAVIAHHRRTVPGTLSTPPTSKQGHTQGSSSNSTPAPPDDSAYPSASEETNAAIASNLDNDDNPSGIIYTVTSGNQPVAGWFVVQVTARNSYGEFYQMAVLHQETPGGQPEVVLGPDTQFPKSYVDSLQLPAPVVRQLRIYNDQ